MTGVRWFLIGLGIAVVLLVVFLFWASLPSDTAVFETSLDVAQT